MGAILNALRRLQRIEHELSRFRAREEAIRKQARGSHRLMDKNAAAYKSHREAVAKCQMEIDHADLDVKSREESMDKHRQALNTAKTNKEYAAILTALNTEKADAAKCESRVLELMACKEELQSESQGFEKERTRLEARAEKYGRQSTDYEEEIKEQRAQLEGERQEAAEALPASVLQTFNRVAGKLGGEAMAEVVSLNTRSDEHVCGGCNMSVTLEMVNRLRGRDELLLCNTCGRILYLDESSVKSA